MNRSAAAPAAGRILAEEKIGERINVKRVKMAAETGAPSAALQLSVLPDHV